MSETRTNKECARCRTYITRYLPGTGWMCKFCGPRNMEDIQGIEPLGHRELTVKSLAARSTLRSRLPEVDTMGARDPDEERIFQLYDGATAREHFAYMQVILDIHQLKLGDEFEGGWWVARKRPTDPNHPNPFEVESRNRP